MAGVRDPAFWKRFSVAVHLDEEMPQQDLKNSDSWLARQHRKRNRRARICCAFWICFAILVAGVVAVIIYLLKSGILEHGSNSSSSNSSTTTASATPTPTSTTTTYNADATPSASAVARMLVKR